MFNRIFQSGLILITLFLLGNLAFAADGVMMVVKGDVQVTSKDGKAQKAKVGMKVFPADTITAGADSRAKIVMSDKNVLNISPDTKIVIEKYEYDAASDNKQVSLKVLEGKVRATVEQKYDGEKNQFHVKTPSAVAGVRGTDFLTSFDAKANVSKVVTFAGAVAVGQPGPQGQIMNPVMVKPGQFTQASGGQAPAQPASVPKDEFNKMNTESTADGKPTQHTDPNGGGDKGNSDKKDNKDDAKKDDAKSDKQDNKQDAKSDQKSDQKGGDKPRAPSSTGGDSMLSSSDLGPDADKPRQPASDSGPGGSLPPPPPPKPLPLPSLAPTPPPIPTPPAIIRTGGKSNVNIIINHP